MKTLHLIPHMMVAFSRPLGGGGLVLENSYKFGIYTIKTQYLIPHTIEVKIGKFNFAPTPSPAPSIGGFNGGWVTYVNFLFKLMHNTASNNVQH